MEDKIDKIREIIEKNNPGLPPEEVEAIVAEIYQATRLDEEKIAKAIKISIRIIWLKEFAKAICSKQDELTKEVRDGKKNY